MKKRFRNRLGGFLKNKSLTTDFTTVYDVIAVNKNDGTIVKIGVAKNINEAKSLKQTHKLVGFSYYILEDKSILTEIPER
tara:strand:- start:43 stop:282 length:240 start_codon:yes stop_codon:yes gene_type:complete